MKERTDGGDEHWAWSQETPAPEFGVGLSRTQHSLGPPPRWAGKGAETTGIPGRGARQGSPGASRTKSRERPVRRSRTAPPPRGPRTPALCGLRGSALARAGRRGARRGRVRSGVSGPGGVPRTGPVRRVSGCPPAPPAAAVMGPAARVLRSRLRRARSA